MRPCSDYPAEEHVECMISSVEIPEEEKCEICKLLDLALKDDPKNN
jgi:hypothetical protein